MPERTAMLDLLQTLAILHIGIACVLNSRNISEIHQRAQKISTK